MAQQDEYDMVCIRLKDHITGLITQGLLLDLNEIALLDLSQPYYDQSAMETLSLGNKLYAVTGDMLIMDNDATRCTVFNADLFEKLQLADQVGGTLYQAVKDGRWTLDMLELCSQAAVSDLNGDQVMTYQDDQWGQANEVFNTFGFLNAGGIFTFE
ncbi:MAG: extracellular solute-binding protein, partial [Clostridia bacterium]|nr:extracellular solute-binding protein [Clostridia bacterium]